MSKIDILQYSHCKSKTQPENTTKPLPNLILLWLFLRSSWELSWSQMWTVSLYFYHLSELFQTPLFYIKSHFQLAIFFFHQIHHPDIETSVCLATKLILRFSSYSWSSWYFHRQQKHNDWHWYGDSFSVCFWSFWKKAFPCPLNSVCS